MSHPHPVCVGDGETSAQGREHALHGAVFGVDGTSPVWAARHRHGATMRSPSATISCTAKTSSENEQRSHRAIAWKPAGPGTRAAGGSAEASRLTAWGMHDGNEIGELLLVGDEEQIPLRQRPEILAIATKPDPRDKIARFAGIASCCKSAAGTQNSTNGGFPEPSPTPCCQPGPVDSGCGGGAARGSSPFVWVEVDLAQSEMLRGDLDALLGGDEAQRLLQGEQPRS